MNVAANAQSNYFEEPQRTFYGGLVAGFNLSTINNFDNPRYNKLGENLGGIVYAKFAKHIAGSMEILYSQKGNVNTTPTTSGIPGVMFTNVRNNLNYAEIPVMINYFDKKEGIIGIGISYSRLVNASYQLSTDPNLHLNPANYPFNQDDFEFLVGGSLHLWQGFFLNIRFQYSIAQIRTNVPTNVTPPEQYNNLWVIRVMYLISRGKWNE